jgi:hypothetical protein
VQEKENLLLRRMQADLAESLFGVLTMGMSEHDDLITNLLTHVMRVLPPLIYYTGIVTYSERDVKGQAEELTVPAFFVADRLSERCDIVRNDHIRYLPDVQPSGSFLLSGPRK